MKSPCKLTPVADFRAQGGFDAAMREWVKDEMGRQDVGPESLRRRNAESVSSRVRDCFRAPQGEFVLRAVGSPRLAWRGMLTFRFSVEALVALAPDYERERRAILTVNCRQGKWNGTWIQT